MDKCFVPSDVLRDCAMARKLKPDQIIQHGLPIRRGFWGNNFNTDVITDSTVSNDKVKDKINFIPNVFKNLFNKEDISNKSKSTSVSNDKIDILRKELGLKPSIPTVLVVGGGDGMGGITQVATTMGKKLASDAINDDNDDTSDDDKYQMVVVCGKNKAAEDELLTHAWGKGVTVQVKGFVNNMDEWMRASDAIVTKAGPGTIAEASICGLPCMLSSYL